MLRLVGAVDVDADIVGLPLRKTGQFDAQIVEMQPCDLLVQVFRQAVNT